VTQAGRPADVDAGIGAHEREVDPDKALLVATGNTDAKPVVQHPGDELALDSHAVPSGIGFEQDLTGNVAGSRPASP
jgi:hypothetical protein